MKRRSRQCTEDTAFGRRGGTAVPPQRHKQHRVTAALTCGVRSAAAVTKQLLYTNYGQNRPTILSNFIVTCGKFCRESTTSKRTTLNASRYHTNFVPEKLKCWSCMKYRPPFEILQHCYSQKVVQGEHYYIYKDSWTCSEKSKKFNTSVDYKSRLVKLELLPLMMELEIADIIFLIKSLRSPSPHFNVYNFVEFKFS